MVLYELKPDHDRPDLLWLQLAFLTDDAALIPSGAKGANGR